MAEDVTWRVLGADIGTGALTVVCACCDTPLDPARISKWRIEGTTLIDPATGRRWKIVSLTIRPVEQKQAAHGVG